MPTMSTQTELSAGTPSAEPLAILERWLGEARRAATQPNPNAMVLATCGADGRPSARVVLCKGITAEPGYIAFYTNYASRKGRELAATGRAAAVFHWDALHRQVRIEGPVVRAPAADSNAYFASRPWQSRLGAWASEQSEPVESRSALERALGAAAERFGAPVPNAQGSEPPFGGPIPRPSHWGGFRLWAESVELWIEGPARIHDRLEWKRALTAAGESFAAGPWSVTRLQP